MSEHFPIPRSHPGRPINRWVFWPLPPLASALARKEILKFAEINKSWQPMLCPYDQICKAVGSELFGRIIMGGGLLIASHENVEFNEGVILIYFDPKKKKFSLSYRHQDVQPDQTEECVEEKIFERLHLFLAYKFGVYIRKREPMVKRWGAKILKAKFW